eukprot:TRINITY_DN29523_c0_g8_i1.p1 TRINITY_DN29523_c0_g8~~TRINITY_DN29523_c0_g8_i1.p1  ORF type:complete len:576 (-),score=139.20 TRINITY_DN29523_c0_g8_i1:148-1875(-)
MYRIDGPSSDPGAFNRLLQALSTQYEWDLSCAVRTSVISAQASPTKTPSGTLIRAPEESSPGPPGSLPPPLMQVDNLLVPNQILEEDRCNYEITDKLRDAGRDCDENGHREGDTIQANGRSSNISGGGHHHKPSMHSQRSFMSGQQSVKIKPRKTSFDEAPTTAIGRFVQGSLFDKLSAVLLVGNAVFIGFQVENSFNDVPPFAIDMIDYFFCVAFLIELGLRLYGYGCYRFWCKKEDRAWNTFDFLIVLLSTFDTGVSIFSSGADDSPLGNISVLRVIRIVRITRVLRIIRVMKFFQDLRILVAAIASTLKTAAFAFMLIMFTMYMFGIAITQMVAEYYKERKAAGSPVAQDDDLIQFFGSIFLTIFTLFMTVAGGIDWRDAAVPLLNSSSIAFLFFIMYVMLMILCVMNVLTGIFCQSAIDTAAADKESVIQIHLQEKQRFIETLQTMFDKMDNSRTGILRVEDFHTHLSEETMQAMLKSLEIEVRDALTLFELLDTDGSGEVDINEFVTGCITLRGGAKAVHMEKVSNMNKVFSARFDDLDKELQAIHGLVLRKDHEMHALFEKAAAEWCEA